MPSDRFCLSPWAKSMEAGCWVDINTSHVYNWSLKKKNCVYYLKGHCISTIASDTKYLFKKNYFTACGQNRAILEVEQLITTWVQIGSKTSCTQFNRCTQGGLYMYSKSGLYTYPQSAFERIWKLCINLGQGLWQIDWVNIEIYTFI